MLRDNLLAISNKKLLLVVIGFFSVYFPFAQTHSIHFDHFLLGDGVHVNTVYEILQDRQGFMWFGTLDGLVLYDGYHFKYYRYDPEGESRIKGTRINGLLEDRSGNIWIIAGQRLQVLDQKLDSFYTFTDLDGDSLIFYSYAKYNEILLQDSSDHIWLGSRRGLFRIQERQNDPPYEVKYYRHDPENIFSLSNDTVHALLYDSQQRLWIGTQHGLNLYDPEGDRIIRSNRGCAAPVTSLCETSSGKICVGTRDAGLCLYDPETQISTHFLPQSNEAHSIAGEWVQQITRDGKGNIWLFAGTADGKQFLLQQFDPERRQFTSHLDPIDPKGLYGNTILHLFVDRTGFLWIVTGLGLIRFDPYQEYFVELRQRDPSLNDWGFSYTFYEDQSGVLWIGTRTQGLLKYAYSTQKFRFYPERSDEDKSISGFLPNPIYEDSQGYLWTSTIHGTNRYAFIENAELQWTAHFPFRATSFLEVLPGQLWIQSSEGVRILNPVTGKMLPTAHIPNLNRMAEMSLKDEEGWLWSASFGKGLMRFNPVNGETMHFRNDPKNPNSISSNYLAGGILQDKEGNIWANGRGGLKRYDSKTGNFSSFLPGINTLQLIEDQVGRFWVTTSGHGLYRFDQETGESKRYSRKEGFPSLYPYGLFEDQQGDLWMSSDVGIIHFDPDTETARIFDLSDGLPDLVFTYGGYQRKNGELFFPLWKGGFIRFHPNKLQVDSIPPRPVIVDFRLFNNSVEMGDKNAPLSQPIWATDQIVLKHDQNVFTLRFTAIHYAAPDQNRVLYKMEGLDEDWIDPGDERAVNYVGLRQGNYCFHLKAANHDGIWSEPVTLKIIVLPPWWKTTWAYLLYAAIIIGGWYFLYRFQLRRKLEEAENLRLKEIDSFKTRFYTNITHEFRTPLTIILGMVEQIKKHPEDWYNEGLKMIKRSGNNLLRLVNQMLDLSKLEAGVLPVHLVQGDIITYLKYVLDSFYSLAAGKNIELHFQSVRKEWLMDYDQEKLREILSNLLSNAIKFTPEGGRVELAVSSWRSAVGNSKLLTGNCLLLTVTDNGIGISKDDLPFIFDRFYSPHPNALSYGESRREAGAGIGLALVKELVKLLGGEISAKSKAGKGSEFRIILPVTNKAPLEQTLPIKPDPESEPAITLVPVDEKEEVAEEITPQLLIIEDNRDVVRYLFSILENDYQVEMAENGEEGMEKALENIPDIIISDVMMPKMDGFELCDKLKKDFRTSHIPIILLTAKADYSSKIEGLERGADAYLAKPFNKEELLVRLQKLLELRKRLQAYYTNFTPLPPSSDKGIQIEDAFLQKLRETVEKNISKEDFGIFEACRSLRISRTQLHRKLKAVTGKSTSHYIRSLRLHKARELLQNSKLNVSEVAFEVGFNSLSYFSRSFKEEFGVNPNEMRN